MTTEADNVVPMEEMNRRRRVNEIAGDIVDAWRAIGSREAEIREMGVPTAEWVDVALRQLTTETQDSVGPMTRRMIPLFIDTIVRMLAGKRADVADYVNAVRIGMAAGSEGEVPTSSAIELITAALPDVIAAFTNRREGDAPDTVTATFALSPEGLRMKQVIDRLFAEAPKLTDDSGKEIPDQAPALECHLILKAGGQLSGALSTTPEGGLRLLAMNQRKGERGVVETVAVEHFFDYEQVADLAVIRPITAEPTSSITTPP